MDTNKNTHPPRQPTEKALRKNLQRILEKEDLDGQRYLVKTLAAVLGVDILDVASALIFINQEKEASLSNIVVTQEDRSKQNRDVRFANLPPIKMVRYRLEVGVKHGLTLEELKKTLVEESGVDKNNILNVDIRDFYTLMELPDEMPQDIFQHLKSVEISRQKLDIKRVKNRNHIKRGQHRSGRGRQRKPKPSQEATEVRYNKISV